MSKKSILIIDDEENFCKLVKKNIEHTGEFDVHIANDGYEGIKLVGEVKPDLILLDIMMPGMDGTEVAALIRNDKSAKDTPIVFLTAIVREGEGSTQTSSTRGYSILAKTVTVGELMTCIKENIRRCKES
ncbi:MAG: response regulator [Candidatus Omnitrophota bacterium]|jgi:CheY-like chemotaxis protein